VFSAAFGPDSKLVVTGNQGGTATAWDSRSGRRLGDLVGHVDVVQDVGFTTESPGGDHIVLTGSDDRTARIWQLRPPAFPPRLLNVLDRTLAVLRGGRAIEVTAGLDRSGQRALIAQDDGTASIFDAIPGETLAVHPDAGDFQLTSDGKRTATLNAAGDIAVWDVSSWSRQSDWIKRNEPPWVAFLSPDGRYVLRETEEAAPARIIEVSRARYPEDDVRLPARHGRIDSAAFSPSSKLVATGYADGAIRVWRTKTGDPVPEGELSKGGGAGADVALDMSFSPDGKLLAVVGSDGSLRVWRLSGRKRLRKLTGHTDQVLGATFSPSGDYLVTSGNDARALVWDRSNWRIVGELEGHENTVSSASFSPDERFVVTSSWDGSVRLWDRAAERELAHFDPGRGRVHRAAFAGQRTIVVTSLDGTGTVTLFRCQVCGSLDSVQRLARRRLRATGRSLTNEERRKYLHEE
jgi:WD40 repeat protein